MAADAGNTNASLQEIVGNVMKVTALTKDLSNASVDKFEGVTSIHGSIQPIGQIT